MSLTRTCRISGKEFMISDEEVTLLDTLSPIIGGEKFSIPLPTLCPEERRRRRFAWKDYYRFFWREDTITGERFLSTYPPESPHIVYSQPRWWGDGWDAMKYGQQYRDTLSIMDQIYTVYLDTPLMGLQNAYLQCENSDYVNGNGTCKDCYIVANGANIEKCLYSWFDFSSDNILDANYITECSLCSYSEHLWKCHNIHYSWDTSVCRDSRYLFSCEGCQYILGGVRLKNQKYQILNTPCTKVEYESTLKLMEHDARFRKDFEKKVIELIRSVGLEPFARTGSVDSTGDFCYESNNTHESYNVGNCEDAWHIWDCFTVRDSMDISMWGNNLSLSYDSIDIGNNSSHIYYSYTCWDNAEYNLYSNNCQSCSYIFGCSGLRNKSYCIFNKQYTKEEWESTVKKIITQMQAEGTWGEFLDPKYSPFAYNESHAMDRMPLSRDEAIARGFRWSDREEKAPEGITKIIPGEKLPDTIIGIPDDVLHWAIKCPKSGKLFQIQPLELELHRKFGIPLPRLHPMERIQKLFSWDKRIFDFDF